MYFMSCDYSLFFGGQYRIRIESIRIRKTQQNFGIFIDALYYLDALITGNFISIDLITSKTNKQKEIIISLLRWKLGHTAGDKYDPYIYEMFESFCQHKTQIVWRWKNLIKTDQQIRDLMFYPIMESYGLNKDVTELDIKRIIEDKDNFCNLFRAEICRMFPNVETVVFVANNSHLLSLHSLLTFIEDNTSWTRL